MSDGDLQRGGDLADDVGAVFDVLVEAGAADLADVYDRDGLGFLQTGPDRVEDLVTGRTPPSVGVGSLRAHHEDASTVGQPVFDLVDRRGDIRERQVGRTEDAVLVVVAPVIEQPAIEGFERLCGGRWVVLQPSS